MNSSEEPPMKKINGTHLSTGEASCRSLTWLRGDEQHSFWTQLGEMRDDSSVHVHISLNYTQIWLLITPGIRCDDHHFRARWGRQVYEIEIKDSLSVTICCVEGAE